MFTLEQQKYMKFLLRINHYSVTYDELHILQGVAESFSHMSRKEASVSLTGQIHTNKKRHTKKTRNLRDLVTQQRQRGRQANKDKDSVRQRQPGRETDRHRQTQKLVIRQTCSSDCGLTFVQFTWSLEEDVMIHVIDRQTERQIN